MADVKLTQNLSNLLARFGGGADARTKVDAITGSLNTRIFHANGDLATNNWAAESLGTEQKTVHGKSIAPPEYRGLNPLKDLAARFLNKPAETRTESTVRELAIQPHAFATLPVGSPENGFVAGAIFSQVGRTFAKGKSFSIVGYQQCQLPEI